MVVYSRRDKVLMSNFIIGYPAHSAKSDLHYRPLVGHAHLPVTCAMLTFRVSLDRAVRATCGLLDRRKVPLLLRLDDDVLRQRYLI